MASELYVETLKGLTSGDNANKVIIPSGQTLDASAGGFTTPAGHVIQVSQIGTFDNTDISTTSTWTDTNMVLSITPSTTSNKILITATLQIRIDGSDAILRGAVRLIRTVGDTSTTIYNTANNGELYQVRGTPSEVSMTGAIELLDEPNTTSAVQYKMQCVLTTGSFFRVRGTANGGNLVLKEIAG